MMTKSKRQNFSDLPFIFNHYNILGALNRLAVWNVYTYQKTDLSLGDFMVLKLVSIRQCYFYFNICYHWGSFWVCGKIEQRIIIIV